MEFQNTYGLAVTSEFAQKYGVTTISDLAHLPQTLRAGFTLEFSEREDGYLGLQDRYGLNVDVITLEPALRYTAINTGEVDVTEVNTTDPEITEFGLVVLEDDQHLFPPYQAGALLRAGLSEEHPDIIEILEPLEGKISTSEMQRMNYAVAYEKRSAATVAREFLEQEGLL